MTGLWRSVLLPHRGRIALALSAAAVSAGIGLLTPYLVKVAIDDGIVAGDLDVLDTVALVYLLAVAVRFTANRVHGVVLASTAHAVLADLRVRVFGHLQGVALGDEGGGDPGTGVGQRLARVVNDVNSLGKALTESASTLVVSGVTLLGAATTLAVLDWRLAAATLAVVPVLVLLGARHQKASGPAWRGLRAAESTTTATTREVFATARTAQAFGREDEAAALVRSALDAENRAERRTVRLSATFFPAVELAGALVTAVVLGLGGGLVLAGDLEVGVLVAFTLYQRALFGPVMGVSDVFDTLQAARAGAERLRETLATAETTPAPADPVPLTPGPHPVRMRAVGFGYTPDRPVLRGVDLTVPAGTSVALVGPTGAGKSTIAKLALRLHDPDHGSVHIGSTDLRQVDPRSLRRTIGYVPQDFPLLPGTVADNLAYGIEIPDSDHMRTVLSDLGGAHLLRTLPDGLATRVGPGGAVLSTSERQLITLARALLRAPTFLVLDEPTSSLDESQDEALQRALHALRGHCTTIVIAHRTTTARACDTAALVRDGQVVAHGNPEDVLVHLDNIRGGRAAG